MKRYVKNRKRSAQQATPLEQSLTIAVASLREGEVVSFGDIAVRAGRPRAPRAAGAHLARSVSTLPWWRVVYADGRLPSCNPTLQTRCLEEEGVTVRGGRVRHAPLGRFADASH
jgi:methylated-DNA-protein-cysteine methyltransferase-like protein